MADDDRLLGSFAEGPVPPLADPAAVRARGDQRRRRDRALLAGTGALVAIALAGTAVLAAGGGEREESVGPIQPVAPSPSYTAYAPLDGDPTSSSTSPTATPTAAAPYIPASAILTASDLPGSVNWVRRASSRDEASEQPVVNPCRDEATTPSAGRTAFLSGSYIIQEEGMPGVAVPESGGVYNAVSRFATVAQAESAYDAMVARVDACRVAERGGVRNEARSLSSASLLIEERGGGVDEPLYPFPVYYGAVRVADLVAVFEYNPGEGTNEAAAARIAALVRSALERG